MDDNRDTCREETTQSYSRKSITDKTHCLVVMLLILGCTKQPYISATIQTKRMV